MEGGGGVIQVIFFFFFFGTNSYRYEDDERLLWLFQVSSASDWTPVGQEPYFVLASMETDHEIVNDQVVFGRFVAQSQLFKTRTKLFHLFQSERVERGEKEKKNG